MTPSELSIGQKVWHLYRLPAGGMTGQRQVVVVKIKAKVKVRDVSSGRLSWVAPKNLRPTN